MNRSKKIIKILKSKLFLIWGIIIIFALLLVVVCVQIIYKNPRITNPSLMTCQQLCETSGGKYSSGDECMPKGPLACGRGPIEGCSCPYDGYISCQTLFDITGCKGSNIGKPMRLCYRTGGEFSCSPGHLCTEDPTCTCQDGKTFDSNLGCIYKSAD